MATMTDPRPSTSGYYWKRCDELAQHCQAQLGELTMTEAAAWVDYIISADPNAEAPR